MTTRTFFFGLTILVLMAACSAANSPSAVVREYYRALEKNDAKALAKVTTSQTAAILSQFETKAQEHVVSLGAIKTVTEEIDGDTAVVTVTFENDEEQIDVIKVDGKWKVSEFD
jgi:membrane-bound lytic murein transglycosylase B